MIVFSVLKVVTESAQASGVVAPVFAYLYEYLQVYLFAKESLNLLACCRAEAFEGSAALADDDAANMPESVFRLIMQR